MGERRLLHIVNGDSVGDKLRQGKIQGDVLVWREVYPFGPVYCDMESHRLERAQYLERTLGIPEAEYIRTCESQEQSLKDAISYDEITLWFEYDLFDQTMLCYLLHRLSKRSLGSTKLNLLCIDAYPGIESFRGLGQLSVGQLNALEGTWRRIGQAELEAGSRVWEAYASPDLQRHVQLLREDTSVLPFVREAFELHLSRLPSADHGMGIIEQVTLEFAADGECSPYELFKSVSNKLHGLGMGDLEYWFWLKRMSQGSHALLEIGGAGRLPDSLHQDAAAIRDRVVRITELGRSVLEGKADWVEGMRGEEDVWFGGLLLHGGTGWR
jgi:hypothetical protein